MNTSQFRQDVSTLEWVIMATGRGKRPQQFIQKRTPVTPSVAAGCPFCPGHEVPEEETLLLPNSSDWQVRIVRNKFPALTPGKGAPPRREPGFFPSMEGVGVHEVIIQSPDHRASLATMTPQAVGQVLLAYRQRFRELRAENRWKSILIFENHGERSGSSLPHPHAQLVATPIVPRDLRIRHAVAQQHYDDRGSCIYCEMLEQELAAQTRILAQSSHFVSLHPFASRSPFETWILPTRHQSSFGDVSDEALQQLARALQRELWALHVGLQNPDYNLVIHTAPLEDEGKDYYLWHLQILPRLTVVAGFELGSGIYINTALPEETAGFIRQVSAGLERP